MSEDDAGKSDPTRGLEWPPEWLEARADEHGVTPDEYLQRVARAVEETEDDDPTDVALDQHDAAFDAEIESIREALDDLQATVDDLDAALERKIQDVRERVIQVKRETDAKAPADHDHPDIERRVGEAADAATNASSRVDALAADIEALESVVDEGFENFEDILEYLTTEVDDVVEKNTRLARAIISMREAVRGMSEREGRRIAADRLREQANELGIRSADCDDCGATLHIALLTDARCPHCASTFASVEPKRGFFGSPTLEVGDRPALEASDAPRPDSVDIDDVISDTEGPSTDPDSGSQTAEGHTDGGETKPDTELDPGDRL